MGEIYESIFLDFGNFERAWRRILTSSHIDTKNRRSLSSFEYNLEGNIEILIEQIKSRTYEPESSIKKYIPKKSGAVRPITILTVRDRVVYQSLANVIAEESWDDLSVVADSRVFGHIPNVKNEDFALKKWSNQFTNFRNSYEEKLKSNAEWLVETDVASFYDSIDHGVLIDVVENYIEDDKFVDLFERCISKWSLHRGSSTISTGIPQGCEASDFLSTLYLLSVDKKIPSDFDYFRYVDDIRIISNKRSKARRSLSKLDIELKKISLSIQTSKTSVRKIDNVDNEVRELSEKLSRVDSLVEEGENKQDELKEMFFDAKANLKESPDQNETVVKFTLNRLERDSTVRNVVIDLIDKIPRASDTLFSYLEKFEGDEKVVSKLVEEIQSHNVYSVYLSKCLNTLSKISKPSVYRDISLRWLANRRLPWPQRLAAVESLWDDSEAYTSLATALSEEPNYLVRQSLITALANLSWQRERENELARWIRKALQDNSNSILLLGVSLYLQFQDISWEQVDYDGSLGPYAELIPEVEESSASSPCYIRKQLEEKYGVNVPRSLEFENFFEDYDGAVYKMRMAISHFGSNPDIYISYINSLNHQISIELEKRIEEDIGADRYGNLIRASAFKDRLPALQAGFIRCNDMRSRTPSVHPISKSTGEWSRRISYSERDKIHDTYLRSAYRELVAELGSLLD